MSKDLEFIQSEEHKSNSDLIKENKKYREILKKILKVNTIESISCDELPWWLQPAPDGESNDPLYSLDLNIERPTNIKIDYDEYELLKEIEDGS